MHFPRAPRARWRPPFQVLLREHRLAGLQTLPDRGPGALAVAPHPLNKGDDGRGTAPPTGAPGGEGRFSEPRPQGRRHGAETRAPLLQWPLGPQPPEQAGESSQRVGSAVPQATRGASGAQGQPSGKRVTKAAHGGRPAAAWIPTTQEAAVL